MVPSRQFFSIFSALCVIPAMLTAGTVISALTDPDNPNLPKDARRDSCYAREITPAVIETVTEKTLISPEKTYLDTETGKTVVARPARYKTEIRQRIVSPRSEFLFETLCPHLYSERFVNSLQRALRARGYYSGKPSGNMDAQTSLAIKLFQRTKNLNSDILALSTIEEFGLIPHRDFNSSIKSDR